MATATQEPDEPDLRCYCCGKPIGETFRVVSMSRGRDRVFIVHDTPCSALVEDDAEVNVLVLRMAPT